MARAMVRVKDRVVARVRAVASLRCHHNASMLGLLHSYDMMNQPQKFKNNRAIMNHFLYKNSTNRYIAIAILINLKII